MISVRQDIVIASNAAFDIASRWTDATGEPYALDDAQLQVRSAAASDPVVLEASVGNGLITLESPAWWAAVSIDESVTCTLQNFGVFKYDLVVRRMSDRRVEQLLYGTALIKRGVTRYG